jgi:hypothetical protein
MKWKEAVVAYVMVRLTFPEFAEGTEENHKNCQSGKPVSGPRFEFGTF